jgi:ribosomal protein S18 acetylase RimI-like enzyme
MEIRLVKQEDLADLKEIWRMSFGDSDNFIDFYFQTRDWLSETAVLLESGKVVSMLTMIPADMVDQDGKKTSAAMLYAIATHPEFQKRGFADRLIEFSNQHLLSIQTAVTLLVPASDELFAFYGKRGYRNGFYVREAVLSRSAIGNLADDNKPCRFVPVKPIEYNAMRRKLMEGHPHLNYRDDEIAFQKQLAVMFGADLYAIVIGETAGCAYAERISAEEVIVKELLIQDQYLVATVKRIAELLPADKYMIRTPAYAGEVLGGKNRPFGMLRTNRRNGVSETVDSCSEALESYLGIAYD